MNRQYKRMMKKEEARKASAPRPQPKAAGAPSKKERTSPRQFFKEVVGELQKVAWPSRQEVVAYSIVVIVSVIVIATLIFGLDYIFTKAVLALFGVNST
ncbi:MAG: preprotein translocase subunit SecE [Actinomycetota bacterium]|nr:preprotein translocase subunit SecE [Actinomycetota bacterium]